MFVYEHFRNSVWTHITSECFCNTENQEVCSVGVVDWGCFSVILAQA